MFKYKILILRRKISKTHYVNFHIIHNTCTFNQSLQKAYTYHVQSQFYFKIYIGWIALPMMMYLSPCIYRVRCRTPDRRGSRRRPTDWPRPQTVGMFRPPWRRMHSLHGTNINRYLLTLIGDVLHSSARQMKSLMLRKLDIYLQKFKTLSNDKRIKTDV